MVAVAFATAAGTAACGDDGAGEAADAAGADAAADSADASTLPDTAADAAGADATPAETTVRAWCSGSTSRMCDWMYRCFDAADLASAEEAFRMTEASCAGQFDAQCQQRTMRSVSEGRQTFDGANASACLAALDDAPCDSLANMAAALNPPACFDVTTGLVDQGGACTHGSDCSADDARCVEGVCTGALGAAAYLDVCSTADGCAGLFCAPVPANAAGVTGVCSATCAAESQCGPGGNCVRAGEQQFCLANCDTDEDCGGTLTCQTLGTSRLCYVAAE